MRACSMLLMVGAVLTFTGSAHGRTIDWEKVDAALGRKAAVPGTFIDMVFLAPISAWCSTG